MVVWSLLIPMYCIAPKVGMGIILKCEVNDQKNILLIFREDIAHYFTNCLNKSPPLISRIWYKLHQQRAINHSIIQCNNSIIV